MSTPTFSRRALLAGVGGLAVAAAWAQTGDAATERYAVLSLIGDKLTMVGYRTPLGSNIDQNDRRIMPISSPVFDNAALLGVDDAIKRLQPKAATTLLSSRDPKLFALQENSLEQPADAADAVGAIKALLQQSKATRLILLSPYRAEARFQMRENLVGSGRVGGLGFYLDRVMRVTLVDSGERGTGYMAPYAFFAVSLIDATTLKTLRRKLITESEVVPTSASKAATVPWETLSDVQKVEALQRLIRRGVDSAIPELLAST